MSEEPATEKLARLRQRHIERYSLDAWASSLPGVRRVGAQVRLAAQVRTPVLLLGEAGTGKQTLARTLHYVSPQRTGACAALDCARLPADAVEVLLFGERNAVRQGLAAVYLRQPEHLPRDLQLRLCERILRDAASSTEPRVLAGCAIAPALLVRSGRLLEELACALGTLVIEVPPLRERMADLPGLVERMLERIRAGRDTQVRKLSADAWAILRGYAWPGNLTELYAVLRDACVRAQGEQLKSADLPADLRRAVEREQTPAGSAERALPLEQLLEEAERRLILLALRRTHGHKARAARLLSIPRPRLWRRMVKLGIVDAEAAPEILDEESEAEE